MCLEAAALARSNLRYASAFELVKDKFLYSGAGPGLPREWNML
jgi:hypothetical protein